MLGPLLFIVYVSYLPMSVKYVTKDIMFVDDTNVIVADKDHDSFRPKTNLVMTSPNQWFYINH